MGYRIVRPEQFEWVTRPHEPGEPARHVADLSDRLGASHVRGNMWRYDPGSDGRRHRHKTREETSVVLAGTLSLYVSRQSGSTSLREASSWSRRARRCSPGTTRTRA